MKKSSITLAALSVLGLSLITPNADAQGWRSALGWGQQQTSSCSQRNTLRQDVYAIDRLASQMVCQFTREKRCGCRDSELLLSHLKKNAALTRNLVTASNGNCKCAFKKAACAVNETANCVAKQSRRVYSLSCSMKGSISQNLTLAKRIHRNADRFTPRNNYTNNHRPTPRPAVQPPVYGRPPVNDHHNHDNGQDQDAFINILYGLFNR